MSGTEAVACGCEVGRCIGVGLTFARFVGRVTLESTAIRVCAKCRRTIGRKGKSYGYSSSRSVDVCGRCHRRNYRRWNKKRPYEATP